MSILREKMGQIICLLHSFLRYLNTFVRLPTSMSTQKACHHKVDFSLLFHDVVSPIRKLINDKK